MSLWQHMVVVPVGVPVMTLRRRGGTVQWKKHLNCFLNWVSLWGFSGIFVFRAINFISLVSGSSSSSPNPLDSKCLFSHSFRYLIFNGVGRGTWREEEESDPLTHYGFLHFTASDSNMANNHHLNEGYQLVALLLSS